jgi:hypothetical protein
MSLVREAIQEDVLYYLAKETMKEDALFKADYEGGCTW